MKVNGNEILRRLSQGKKDDRTKVSLYLSKSLYEQFRKACGDVPASQVMEELMRLFNESVRRS